MLELLLTFCLVVAIYRGYVAGRYFAVGCAAAALYLLVLDTANFAAASFVDLHPLHAFIFLFLGPGLWHHRGASCLVGGALFAAAPWLARAARLCICSAVAWRCSHKAARLGPLVLESETLGWLAEPFYGAAVCDALETLLFVLARTVAGDGQTGP
jgi:hypothetical protein